MWLAGRHLYNTICHGIQPEVSDTDIYNKLLYCINADPYSLTLGDIVSTEGISVSDKTKALEELQRNQEITGRPNYKAARELFDIDFKQKFGEDLSIDPAEEKAKWLRVFHSYIIDKKMEPLDAAEKIRKDYQVAGQEEPSSQPPPEGNITNTPSQEFDETNPLKGGVGKSTTKHHQVDARNPKFNPQSETQNLKSDIDPTDSLFAGIGKSVIQGTTSFPRTFWGAGAMLEDIAKNVPQAIPLAAFTQIVPEDFFKRRYEDVKGIEERFQAKGEGYKKYVNGAIRTMSEMLSQYAGTAGMGTLTGMSTGAGVDKYLGARKEGYSIPRSFAAGGVTAATEYVTEKSPLAILGRPGLKFVDRLMMGLVSDVYGEVNAKLAEMSAVDYAILGKSHTPWDYLRALRDTIFMAAATTLGVTSVTHPFTRGETQQMPGGQKTKQPQAEQVQQAQAAQQTQQAPEIPPLGSFDTPDIIKAREEQKTIPETNLINTQERQALRKQVANTLLTRGSFTEKDQNGKDVFGGPVESNRIADIVIGLPAAGKSSFVHDLSKENRSLIIDADEAKPFLGDLRHAGVTHKESGNIVDDFVTPEAVDQGKNIILPIVGKNINRVRGWRDTLVDAGYLVNLHFIDLPPEKAAQRAVERFQKTGRFVDPDYVLNLGLTPSKNYDILKQEKGWAGYEKYSTDVERGRPPVLSEQGGGLSTDAERSLRLPGGRNAQGVEGRASKSQGETTTEIETSKEINKSQKNTTPQHPPRFCQVRHPAHALPERSR